MGFVLQARGLRWIVLKAAEKGHAFHSGVSIRAGIAGEIVGVLLGRVSADPSGQHV